MIIYTLASSFNPDNIRYVGVTSTTLEIRLNRHRNLKNKGNARRFKWIKSVIESGFEIIISDWQFSEIYWIAQFKAWGFDLVNSTEGGEGSIEYKHTEETKRKISENHVGMKGKTHSDESNKKNSISHLGNTNASGKRSDKTKKRISAAKKG